VKEIKIILNGDYRLDSERIAAIANFLENA